MMIRRIAAVTVITAFAWMLGPAVFAEQPPPDALSDLALKGPEIIAFLELNPGNQVADVFAGRFVRALSQAVGPKGKVYAFEPSELVKAYPAALDNMKQLAVDPTYANVVVSTHPINSPALPANLDAVFIRQNYHDLHNKFMGPADVAAFNRNVFATLKPGGVFVVLDHADKKGTSLKNTDTLHRIDVAAVKSEVLAAGFVLDGESKILINPSDDHTKNVFDTSIRGKTDQFLLRFRNPTN